MGDKKKGGLFSKSEVVEELEETIGTGVTIDDAEVNEDNDVPNEETQEAIDEVREGGGESFDTVDDMVDAILADTNDDGKISDSEEKTWLQKIVESAPITVHALPGDLDIATFTEAMNDAGLQVQPIGTGGYKVK